jgi:hypothetical protein
MQTSSLEKLDEITARFKTTKAKRGEVLLSPGRCLQPAIFCEQGLYPRLLLNRAGAAAHPLFSLLKVCWVHRLQALYRSSHHLSMLMFWRMRSCFI